MIRNRYNYQTSSIQDNKEKEGCKIRLNNWKVLKISLKMYTPVYTYQGVVRWCEGVLRHRGIQLIVAYSWAKPAILVAGKGRGGTFLFLLFLHFYSWSSFIPVPLFHLLYYIVYLYSPFLWETTQNEPQELTYR